MMKQFRIVLLGILLISIHQISAQGVVMSGNPAATPHSSAIFQVDAVDGGLMIPQLTATQRKALSTTAAQGLWVYQTDEHPGLYVFNDSTWTRSSSKTLSGKVEVDYTISQALIGGHGPFTVTQDPVDSGRFDITFAPGSFNHPPSVSMSAQAYPPLTTIEPSSYCEIGIINHCGTCSGSTICHDQMDDVIAQSYPNGTLNASFGFNDSNTDCDNGYRDMFNTLTLVIDAGGTSYYRLTMSASAPWSNQMFGYIDWDQSGEFEPNERVYFEQDTSAPYDESITSLNLTAPSGAFNGTTVLRAISTFGQSASYNPCGTQTWGEVHDYKVIVQNGTAPTSTNKDPRAAICNVANITSSGFSVSCATGGGVSHGTSFHFYATEN